jgi:demethylmenaquinone methyltransferase/2-methoxy-6-polyprenyl-1,4-benzoquinol methylase
VQRSLQSKAETRAFYNKIAAVYDLLAERSERPIRETALDMLNALPSERMLEIGFGTGHCLVALARDVGEKGRIFGVDLSESMVTQAEKLLTENQMAGRVELEQADAIHLPFKANSLDGILMTFTLELFDTPEIPKVLAECRRVLKPGGRIAVAALSRLHPDGLMTAVFEWTHRHFPNLLDCRPILVSKAIEQAGFQIHKSEVKMMWVPVEIVLACSP